MRDIRSDLRFTTALAEVISGNGTVTSGAFSVDKEDNGVLFVFSASAYTDGVHLINIQDSDDGSTGWADLEDGQYIIDTSLTLNALDAVGDDGHTLGIRDTKEFVRAQIVSTGVTTGATIASYIVRKNNTLPFVE